MTACLPLFKNRAISFNLSSLSDVLLNVTRWSSISAILSNFVRLRDTLISVSNNTDSLATKYSTNGFSTLLQLYAQQFQELNVVENKIQKRGITLSDSRFAIDELREGIFSDQYDM